MNRINFLYDVPNHPEPLYVPGKCYRVASVILENNKILSDCSVVPPKMRSPLGEGSIVYSNLPGPEKYVS